MMQLGFMTAILPEADLEEVFRTAAEIGYDCVELMCWPVGKAQRRYAGVTHLEVESIDQQAIDRVTELTAKYGVNISGLGYYPNPLTPDKEESEKAIEHLRRLIIASGKLGIGQVNSFVGRDWTKSIDDNWPRFVEVWRPLVELAEEHNVRIGIENCPMFFSNDEWPGGKNLAFSPAIWRRMFESIPNPNFGLNYDPSHMIWLHMDYVKPIREFRDRLFHVHAKDVRVEQHLLDDVGILANPQEYHSPKLPGLGMIDWGAFCSALGDIKYDGPVCVEVEDRAYEGSAADCRAALQQSHTYLRNFLPPNSSGTAQAVR